MKPELIEAFVFDFEKLLLTQYGAHGHEVLLNALILRKLLLDSNNISAFNRFLQINEKLYFNDVVSSLALDDDALSDIRIYIPHVECLPRLIFENYTAVALTKQKLQGNNNQFTITNHELAFKLQRIDNFLNDKWIIVNGKYFSKRDLIEYCCYRNGGVHYGIGEKKLDRLEGLDGFTFTEAQGPEMDCAFYGNMRYKFKEDEDRPEKETDWFITLGDKYEFKTLMILEIGHCLATSASMLLIYDRAKEYLIQNVYRYKKYSKNELFTLRHEPLYTFNVANKGFAIDSSSQNVLDQREDIITRECQRILIIKDADDQDEALIDLEFQQPNHINVLLTRAHIDLERGYFKRAKKIYEKTLQLYPGQPDCTYNLANILAEYYKDHQLARKLYEHAIEQKPNFEAAYFNLANLCCIDLGEFDTGVKYYEKAIELNPAHSGAHNNLGLVLFDRFKELDAARDHFLIAVGLNPQNADAYNNLGNIFYTAYKDYAAARKYFEIAIDINPKLVSAYNNYAALLLETSAELNLAKEYFEKAISLDLNYKEAFLNYGLLLETKFDDFAKAKTQYENALSIDPSYGDANYAYGRLLDAQFGDFENAKKHYQRSVLYSPKNAAAYNNLARILHLHYNDHEQAKVYYEKSIEVDPLYSSGYFNLGLLNMDHYHNYDKAVHYYKEVIKLVPDHFYANFNLGKIYHLHFKDYDKATTYYDLALTIDSKCAELYYNQAILSTTLLQDAEEIKHKYEVAIELNPKYGDAYGGLGYMMIKEGTIKKAKYYLELALSFSPDNIEANYNIGTLLLSEFHDFETAKWHFEKVLSMDNNRADAHLNLTSLIMQQDQNIAKAKIHYQKAVKINPSLKNELLDQLFLI